MSDSDFYMVQLGLDAKGLTTLGKMLHLPLDRTDTGYLVHCALGELFGDEAPQPFSIENESQNGRQVRVLGYTAADADTLQTNAQLDASPTVYEIGDWDGLAAKPMPQTFPEGMTLQFELRACPVVRKASAGEGVNHNGDKRTWTEGQELDAYLAEARGGVPRVAPPTVRDPRRRRAAGHRHGPLLHRAHDAPRAEEWRWRTESPHPQAPRRDPDRHAPGHRQ